MTPQDYIQKCLELSERATKGPWFYDRNGCKEGEGPHGEVWFSNETGRTAIVESAWWNGTDAEFIAFSRTALPKLSKALREAIAHLRMSCRCDEERCSHCYAVDHIEAIFSDERGENESI
jgi:hypothetical protein